MRYEDACADNIKVPYTERSMAGSNESRQPKPDILMTAIYNLEDVEQRVLRMLEKIRDGNIPKEQTTGPAQLRQNISIALLLNEGPDRINNFLSGVSNYLDQIDQELF